LALRSRTRPHSAESTRARSDPASTRSEPLQIAPTSLCSRMTCRPAARATRRPRRLVERALAER
jgi:hypothetical protein